MCVCVLFIFTTTFNLTKYICSFFRKDQLSSSIGLTCGRTDKENHLFVSCWKDALKPSSSKFSVPNFWSYMIYTQELHFLRQRICSQYLSFQVYQGLLGRISPHHSNGLHSCAAPLSVSQHHVLPQSSRHLLCSTGVLALEVSGRAGKKLISTNVPLIY